MGVLVVLWQRVVCELCGVQLRPAVGVLLCCGSMLCVVCELCAVQLRPAVGVLVVLYSARRSELLSVLNCNFSKEQSVLPEDDRMIETCRSVLSVSMQILDY